MHYTSTCFVNVSFIDWAEESKSLLAKLPRIVKPQVSVQSLDLGNVVIVEGEAKEVEVLLYPIPVGGLRDDRASPLNIPPQNHLKCGMQHEL